MNFKKSFMIICIIFSLILTIAGASASILYNSTNLNTFDTIDGSWSAQSNYMYWTGGGDDELSLDISTYGLTGNTFKISYEVKYANSTDADLSQRVRASTDNDLLTIAYYNTDYQYYNTGWFATNYGSMDVWTNITLIYKDGTSKVDIYIDNTLEASDVDYRNNENPSYFYFRAKTGKDDNYIRNFCLYDGTTNYEDCFAVDEPSANPNLLITSKNKFNNSKINMFNVTIDNAFFFTTNGTIVTNISSDSIELVDIAVCSENYFCKEYNDYDVSTDLIAELFQTYTSVSIKRKFDNQNINDVSLYNEDQLLLDLSNSSTMYINGGNYSNVSIRSNSDSFTPRYVSSIYLEPKSTNSINYEIYNKDLEITAEYIKTSSQIINFTININSQNHSDDRIFSTASGNMIIPIVDDYYNLTIDATGYALYNNNVLLYLNSSYEFSLYTDNSIQFYIYDENTNEKVTENVTVKVNGFIKEYSGSTLSGDFYIDNLIDDEYSIQIISDDYLNKYYSINVENRSFQTLNTYINNANNSVIFTVKDQDTGEVLTSAFFTVYRFLDDEWVVINSKMTDISGKIEMNYYENTNYRFIISKDGYNQKTFNLDPILYDTYNILMEKDLSQTIKYDDIIISQNPNYFTHGNNSIEYIIQSQSGSLESYDITLISGSTYYLSGDNAIGGVLSQNLTIPTSQQIVRVVVEYETSYGSKINKSFEYYTWATNETQISGNVDKTYGLGLLERILIVVFITLIVSGISFFIGGIVASLVMGLLTYTAFVILGFIPLWAILISLLAGFFVIIKGGQNE